MVLESWDKTRNEEMRIKKALKAAKKNKKNKIKLYQRTLIMEQKKSFDSYQKTLLKVHKLMSFDIT